MTSGEIEGKLSLLIEQFDREEFIYDFLLAYGISKTSVTRLKKGDYNLAKKPGELLYKNKIYFKTAPASQLLLAIEEAALDPNILKHGPRLILITDFETIVARDLKKKINADFALGELPKFKDFFVPLTGAEIYKASNDNKADREAAYQLAKLYDMLVVDNPDLLSEGSHQLNLFLSRILFCFFAEDTGIFKTESIFTNTLANHTDEDGANVHNFLNGLFRRLNTKEGEFATHLQEFPYVNGGLFRDEINSPHFSRKSRAILLDCGNLEWGEINPDIFGSMIQAVADPEERSDLGMHYTSVPNIKKVIEPLFLNDLYAEFEKHLNSANNLKKLLIRISRIKFFDPACGSGNFLIITYKELRLLEIKIIKCLIDLDAQQNVKLLYFTGIQLSQFYGIEIKDFAHEMALLSLWLAEHQMNKVFEDMLEGYGRSKPILPLKEAGHIVCANATRYPWPEACPASEKEEVYLLGNPPYLGSFLQSKEQKADLAFVCHGFKSYKDLDYIACWFIKAAQFVEGSSAKFAFVTTNSVCQGEQVILLWPYIFARKLEIQFAYKSFKWTNNAKKNAGVYCTIIGIGARNLEKKKLFAETIYQQINNISPYLTNGNNTIVSKRMKPLSVLPPMNYGSKVVDGGHLIFKQEQKDKLLARYPQARPLFKKFVGSAEFIRGLDRYCLYMDDCDLEMAMAIPEIAARLDAVTEFRLKSTEESTRKLADKPHEFYYSVHDNSDSIIIPRTSSERREYIPMGFLNGDSVISDAASAIFNAQPWIFGIVNSRLHMTWVRTVAGRLKTDYRYSSQLCYNTFPIPEVSGKQKEILGQYVFGVLDERAKFPEKTMAWLYNPETMPPGLKQAHIQLDEAVERIYRLSPFQSDTERLEYLFRLYEEMIQKDTLFAKSRKIKKVKATLNE
ncbi:class I SAM-dependent DNA methyltransferase [Mucilaginibacter dorajii]|uniref:site-specific DNA-methyltransferase (adenine-specific) n=1 Tax=Mucilaginibacter dorajii TaxID=692994 RepID=A0ABP7R683_9SPHI|nr:DNA methyltransferase [Mucilaginibacter dorajii]MCS3737692.1 hypothetical protein [Mucilaginibacter dorajii]